MRLSLRRGHDTGAFAVGFLQEPSRCSRDKPACGLAIRHIFKQVGELGVAERQKVTQGAEVTVFR